MKYGSRAAALGGACTILCGCALLPQNGVDSTSGLAQGDTPVTTLAISANPVLSPDAPPVSGPNAPDPAAIQRFAADFARTFSAGFPAPLSEHGVQPHDPGYRVPLLRVGTAAYRRHCEEADDCRTEVRIDGSLLDGSGAEVWSFRDWLELGDMDALGYKRFYKALLFEMTRDQAIPAGGRSGAS